MSHSRTPSSDYSSVPVDRVVQSVTNATKRLSQISTHTNLSAKKRKNQNRIGPWKLGRTLGRGLTGRVRLAKNIDTGKLAAVKIVPKSNFKKLENPKYRRLASPDGKDHLPYGIEREIIIMKLIAHPNIMGLYDVWENKNDLYLILEYIEGGELFDYLIKRGKLQEFEAVSYFKQIIHGIGYLHQLNICHRDLKPENLLLDFNKNIKIADFGMAALEIKEKLLETSCGSPHYASPEIVAGKNYHGAPSDIWSCGIILFALLTGHLPFDDENIRKLLLKVQNGKFLMPPDLSLEAKDLITKMLQVNPADRVTIDEILQHPLLKKYPEPLTSSTSYFDLKNVTFQPIELAKKIDREILKNLSVLFHNCDEQTIIKKLLSPAKCSEKVFYYLLMKYRNEHNAPQNYEEDTDMTASESKNSFPRSTSIVRITTTDPSTGSKYTTTTVQKIPPSNSIHSSKSRKNVLGNITNTHTNSPKNKNFAASTSFTKKKHAMSTHSSSRSLKAKSKSLLKRKPTGLLALENVENEEVKRKGTQTLASSSLMNFEKECQDVFEKPVQRRPSKNLSPIERHERELAMRVHKQNEEREHRYLLEAQAKAKAEVAKLNAAKAAAARAEANEVEKLNLEKAKRAEKQASAKKLSETKKQARDGTVQKADRRSVTEPIHTSSLDPRTKNINSLLRAKSLASPSSYSSLRKGSINQNTTKVLQLLGVDLNPGKINESVKTSSSRHLSSYLQDSKVAEADDISLGDFNEIEKENVGPLPTILRSGSQKSAKSERSQRSQVSQWSTDTKSRKPHSMPYKSLLGGIDETGKTLPSMSPPREPLLRKQADTTMRTLDSRRTGLIPNPRFSRFSFNGLLGNLNPSTVSVNEFPSAPSQTTVSNSLLRGNTVVKSPRQTSDLVYDKTLPSLPTGMLKKSSTNLLGLGIDLKSNNSRHNSLVEKPRSRQLSQRHTRQVSSSSEQNHSQFVSVHLGDTLGEETHIQSDGSSQNTILGDESQPSFTEEKGGIETDISNFDIISSRTAEIGALNKSRPSLIDNLLDASKHEDAGSDKMTIKSLYKDYERIYGDDRSSSRQTTKKSVDEDRISHRKSSLNYDLIDKSGASYSRSATLNEEKASQFDQEANGFDKEANGFDEEANGFDDEANGFDEEANGFDEDRYERATSFRQNEYEAEDLQEERAPTRASTQVFSTLERLADDKEKTSLKQGSEQTVDDYGADKDVGRYSTIIRRMSLKPKREAPRPPPASDIETKGHHRLPRFSVQSKIYTSDDNGPKAESKGWFRKLIDSIGSRNKPAKSTAKSAGGAQYNKKIQILDSKLSASELMRVIRNTLEMKRIEGSVSKVNIDEEFGLINGTIPAKFTGGRKLKFRIEIMDLVNASSLHVENLRGPTRSFKNLVNIIKFIVEQEEQANDRQDGYEFSGNRVSTVKAN